MVTRIGINGFGRIGRLVVRAIMASHAKIEVTAINDLADARPTPTFSSTTRTTGFSPAK